MRSRNLRKQATTGKKNPNENGDVMFSGHQLFLIFISILVCASIIANSAAYGLNQEIQPQNNVKLIISAGAT